MWFVVHFHNENTIEAVPNIWFNDKEQKCASSKNSVKKMIERRTYPNKLEFKWFSARILGHPYSSLFEARSKANKGQFLSDLSSENENIKRKKKDVSSLMSSIIPNPPSLVKRKKNNSKNVVVNNTISESEIDDDILYYDSDKDPEYNPEGLLNTDMTPVKSPNKYNTPVKSTNTSNTPVKSSNSFNNYNYLKSPIGKIHVENYDPSMSIHQKHFSGSSSQPAMHKPFEIVTPAYKRALFISEPSKKSIKDTVLISATNTDTTINQKKKDIYSMPPADFQKFVISALTKIKYDIAGLTHTVNAAHLILDSNQNNLSSLSNTFQETFVLDEAFPIKTNEELEYFEKKIENDKQFRFNIISKLSLMVGIKNVGDSVRRLMSKMFDDEILVEYSLQGFKKKKCFQKLGIYRLLIDAIRIHKKFSTLIDREFDVPLATWIAHAKFRLLNKNQI